MISTPVSTFTDKIDVLFWAIVILSAILLIGITITMIYFVIRYNYKRHPKASQIEGHTVLEIIWTIIPLIIVMTMFYYGYEGFQYMRDVPENSMVVKVTGRMWDWFWLVRILTGFWTVWRGEILSGSGKCTGRSPLN